MYKIQNTDLNVPDAMLFNYSICYNTMNFFVDPHSTGLLTQVVLLDKTCTVGGAGALEIVRRR